MSNSSLKNANDFLSNRQNLKYRKTKIDVGYGLSETVGAATSTLFEGCSKLNLGKAFPLVNIKIVDFETKEEVPTNIIGEICISGPTVMKGYYNMPEENKKMFSKDTNGNIFLHTGDMGSLDDTGELNVYGRIRRMVTLYNGYKIATQNLEEMIESLDEVKACVVVGVKDPHHSQGHLPKAYISIQGKTDKSIESRIRNLIRENMNERNEVYEIEFINEIPLTKMGKKDFVMLETLSFLNEIDNDIKCKYFQPNNEYDYGFLVEIKDGCDKSKSEVLSLLEKAIEEKYKTTISQYRKSVCFKFE